LNCNNAKTFSSLETAELFLSSDTPPSHPANSSSGKELAWLQRAGEGLSRSPAAPARMQATQALRPTKHPNFNKYRHRGQAAKRLRPSL